jgi:hypothetical protein
MAAPMFLRMKRCIPEEEEEEEETDFLVSFPETIISPE